MNTFKRIVPSAAMLTIGLMLSAQGVAADSALPRKPEALPQVTQSVQSEINKKTDEIAAEKRKQLMSDAQSAIAETEKALQSLKENKKKEALDALAIATRKLELVLARNPTLALAPISTEVVTHDLLANRDTVKAVLTTAKDHLKVGEIQKARPLLGELASEIQFRTSNIPLETYPTAIKAITPLIDAGKIDEAKAGLQAMLNTIVITTEVTPLPKLRAEQLLKSAQTLVEKKDRSKEESDKLAKYFQGTREQLEMAELLGYGSKKDFKPMYEQLDQMAKKSADGKSGTGWFEKIKKQLTDWI